MLSVRAVLRGGLAAAGIAMLVAAVPATANAGVITETQSYGPAATNWRTTLSFAGFDTSLGTLTQVDFLVTEVMTGGVTLSTTANSSKNYTVTLTNTGIATLPVIGSLKAISSDSDSGSVIKNHGASVSLSGNNSSSGSTTTSLASFETPFTVLATDSGVLSPLFSPVRAGPLSDLGTLTVLATYTYSPVAVAEPMSIAVLGAGLLGVMLVRPRRAR